MTVRCNREPVSALFTFSFVLAVILSAACVGCVCHGELGGQKEESGRRFPLCPEAVASFRDTASPVLGVWYGMGIVDNATITIARPPTGGSGAALIVSCERQVPDVYAGPSRIRDGSFRTYASYRDGMLSMDEAPPGPSGIGDALVSIRLQGIHMLIPCGEERVVKMLSDGQPDDPSLPFALLVYGAFMRLPDFIQVCRSDYERSYR